MVKGEEVAEGEVLRVDKEQIGLEESLEVPEAVLTGVEAAGPVSTNLEALEETVGWELRDKG